MLGICSIRQYLSLINHYLENTCFKCQYVFCKTVEQHGSNHHQECWRMFLQSFARVTITIYRKET